MAAPGETLWRFSGHVTRIKTVAGARVGFKLRPELAHLQAFSDALPEPLHPHSDRNALRRSRWGSGCHGSAVIIEEEVAPDSRLPTSKNCQSEMQNPLEQRQLLARDLRWQVAGRRHCSPRICAGDAIFLAEARDELCHPLAIGRRQKRAVLVT